MNQRQSQQNQRGRHHGGGQQGHRSNSSSVAKRPSKEDVTRFIKNDDATKDMVKACEAFGAQLTNDKLSTSQLRNAYGSMKKLEMSGWSPQTQSKLLLLKPRLAYAGKRHGNGMATLSAVLADAIDAIENELDFKRFCNFFEAIVAYFKAAGGK